MSEEMVSLAGRFRSIFTLARENFLSDAPIVVATSGGLDSVALLHLFRFLSRINFMLHTLTTALGTTAQLMPSGYVASVVPGVCHSRSGVLRKPLAQKSQHATHVMLSLNQFGGVLAQEW